MAAMLGYLTGRWLERLTEEEKKALDENLTHRNTLGSSQPAPQRSTLELVYYTWMALSLFVPMPLLTCGVICMMAGIYTYIWTQHSPVVAALVTLAGGATLPFIVGDYHIGMRKNSKRREEVIRRLSEMQGDW
jgi:membrane protein YqaA with SNARE-associated domain